MKCHFLCIAICFCSIVAVATASAQPVGRGDVEEIAITGTATERGEAIPMRGLKPYGTANGVYELFTLLRKGTFSIVEKQADGSERRIGQASKSRTKAGGKPWKNAEERVVRVRYDRRRSRLDITPISIFVKGNIARRPILLPYAGDGIFKGRVCLDADSPQIFSEKSIYFSINGSDSAIIGREKGSRAAVAMPAEGYETENIRINQGIYTLTLNTTAATWEAEAPIDERRISVFGSSVANGQGARDNHGYAYQYGERLWLRHREGLSPRAFRTSGVSIGGNTTASLMNRYDELTHDFGRYVIIGLSMANEGLSRLPDKEAVYRQFSDGMRQLIDRVRAEGKVPIVTNNYANNDYTATEYAYIRRINHDIHLWDVPSINLLGAIDRGDGHWTDGYYDDNWHPSTIGHEEMSFSFPPSMMDALAAGKPLPQRQECEGIALNGGETISYKPESNCHSFTISVKAATGEAARLFSFTTEEGSYTGTVAIDGDGHLTYSPPYGGATISSTKSYGDADYHQFTLTHYYAARRTLLYADSTLIGTVHHGGGIGSLTIGNNATAAPISIGEIFVWRAGMNSSEIKALCSGEMLKSSLEIYSPLTASVARQLSAAEKSTTIENKAQSLATLVFLQNE